jgi:hypothetical protein
MVVSAVFMQLFQQTYRLKCIHAMVERNEASSSDDGAPLRVLRDARVAGSSG